MVILLPSLKNEYTFSLFICLFFCNFFFLKKFTTFTFPYLWCDARKWTFCFDFETFQTSNGLPLKVYLHSIKCLFQSLIWNPLSCVNFVANCIYVQKYAFMIKIFLQNYPKSYLSVWNYIIQYVTQYIYLAICLKILCVSFNSIA